MELTKREFMMGAAALALLGQTRGVSAAQAITYWHHFTSQSEMAGLLKVVELFQAAQGDVTVTQEGIPNDQYMAKVSSAVLAGGRPDTGMVITERFADLQAMGALTDITERANAWSGKANLPENRWKGLSKDGEIYAVPAYLRRLDVLPQGLVRRGRPSAPPKTYEEFRDAADQADRPGQGPLRLRHARRRWRLKYVLNVMEASARPSSRTASMAIDREKAIEAVDLLGRHADSSSRRPPRRARPTMAIARSWKPSRPARPRWSGTTPVRWPRFQRR